MAHYAIGDVQGCFLSLEKLLEKISFKPTVDTVILLGDLVNRGPRSLEVLRFAKAHEESVYSILGNHDIHLLAYAIGAYKTKTHAFFEPILQASDGQDLIRWLQSQPLMRLYKNYAFVHAGVLPGWSFDQALVLAKRIEQNLQSPNGAEFLKAYYQSVPEKWGEVLSALQQLHFALNIFIRVRFCFDSTWPDMSRSDSPFSNKEKATSIPWFELLPQTHNHTYVFGHWAALGFYQSPNAICLDSGCVWGKHLTALCLDDGKIYTQANIDKSEITETNI